MRGFKVTSLEDMLNELGKESVLEKIAAYSCPANKDVENFLRKNAVQFNQMALSKTYLVYASYKEEWVIVGYFTLANKGIEVAKKARLNKSLRKRIDKFAHPNEYNGNSAIPAPLIAQLGKNFTNGYNKIISGDELLEIACSWVRAAQTIVGGKVVYLECEDKPNLIEFYERNGFISFGKRGLERLEKDVMSGEYLVQMLKYLD